MPLPPVAIAGGNCRILASRTLRSEGSMTVSSSAPHPLVDATNREDLAAVRAILAAGTCTHADLDLALARAALAFNRRRGIAELLIAHGADPNGQYGGDYGPIALVTGECLDPDGLRFLIDHGADVAFAPIPSKYGATSMLISTLGTYARGANERKHRCIALLLEHGAPVPATIDPAQLAIHRGDAEALVALLAADPHLIHRRYPDMPYGNVALTGGTLLHCAVEFDEHACIRVLLDAGADPVADASGGRTPLFHAIDTGWSEKIGTLELLAELAGPRLDPTRPASFILYGEAQGPLSALTWAEGPREEARYRHAERERAVLRRLALPVLVRRAVAALVAGDVDVLATLLRDHPALATARLAEEGEPAHTYCVGPTLLHLVANNPNRSTAMPLRILESAQLLLDAGAVVDAPTLDPGAAPALTLIASSGPAQRDGVQVPLIELLVARGADPTRALDAAIHERCPEAAAALRRLGAPATLLWAACQGDAVDVQRLLPAATAEQRADAAHAAVNHGRADCLALLLDAGVPIDAPVPRHPHRPTLLHQAGSFGRRAVAELLLARGADPTLRDATFGGTPAGWARHGGHAALAELLERAAGR